MLNKLHSINLSFYRSSLPVILQTEAAECGLACLSMISAWHHNALELKELRRKYGVSQKGITLEKIINISHENGFSTRCLRLELSELNKLTLPCILHWNLNHFVVLKKITRKRCIIHDPAIGLRELPLSEVSKSFTGVALEIIPEKPFETQRQIHKVKLNQLIGRIVGLKSSIVYVILIALTIELLNLLVPLFTQWTIDNAIVSGDSHLLLVLMIGYALTLFIKQSMSLIRDWALMFITTTVRVQWQGSVFRHMVRLPTDFFERRHLGDLVSRFGSVETIQSTLSSSFMVAILDGILSIVTLAMMLIYSGKLALIPCTAIVLYIIGRLLWFRPLFSASQEQIIHAATQSSHMLETMRGIKTLKLFQRNNQRADEWLTLMVKQLNADVRTQKLHILFQQTNGVLFAADNLLVLGLGASMVIHQAFTVGLLMAFISYKGQFLDRIRNLVDNAFALKMLSIHTERLADIVLTEPEEDILYDSEDQHATPPAIALQNLSFSYAPGDALVLHDVSFTVEPGECVALTGMSGCGKTTLGQLILGTGTPVSGEILIDNIPLNQFGLGRLRSISAAVMQDDVLFAGTILDNITFFDINQDRDFAIECARMAAIHQDIMSMPMQYHTMVGDMGAALSGGQKQRILIARALYRKPQFLLLDEASSHLDLRLEKQVNDALKDMKITRLIIAHRPQTLMLADRVIFLDKGRVVEEKGHKELIEFLQEAQK
ncbi:ATP-binding cassette domain-containing protein [Erwinia sp. CPCC 100877]|nr:ATP-binding cassette domain-containing protein [Erwinia sp. CPCC 100877]